MSVDITNSRAVCDAATPGPWYPNGFNEDEIDGYDGTPIGVSDRLDTRICLLEVAQHHELEVAIPFSDMKFIAAARTGWPAALDEIAELRVKLKGAEDRTRLALDAKDVWMVRAMGLGWKPAEAQA